MQLSVANDTIKILDSMTSNEIKFNQHFAIFR